MIRRVAILVVLFSALVSAQDHDDAHQEPTLQELLADAHATILQKDIQISTLKATLDSVVESQRAADLVAEFQAVFGGEWVWDGNTNRPRRVDVERK